MPRAAYRSRGPPPGCCPGCCCWSSIARRASLLALGGALLLLCHLLADYDAATSVGFTLASVLGTWLVLNRLAGSAATREAARGLAEEGDVSP